MKKYVLLGVPVAAAALVVSAAYAADLKSGPQVGGRIQIPFHPLNVTGASAGKKNCLV